MEQRAALITWNINGLGARYDELVDMADEYSPDVICLQETKYGPGFPDLGGYVCFESPYGVSRHHGAALYIREALAPVRVELAPELSGHAVAAELAGGARVVSLYTKNSGNERATMAETDARRMGFDAVLWSELERIQEPSRQFVVAGDLNVCLTPGDHYSGTTSRASAGRKPYEIAAALAGIASLGLRDVYMDLNPEHAGERWTYWSRRGGAAREPRDSEASSAGGRGWRLDYVLATRPAFTRAEVLQRGSSDHRPVAVW